MSKIWYATASTVIRNGVVEHNYQLPHLVDNVDFIDQEDRDRLCFDTWSGNGILSCMGEGWSVSQEVLIKHYIIGMKYKINHLMPSECNKYFEVYNECIEAYGDIYPEMFI